MKRGRLPLFMLIAFLSAFPFKVESVFQPFRLRELSLNMFPSARMEKEALYLVNPNVYRFWPIIIGDRVELIEDFERTEPVKLDLISGLGSLKIAVRPLNVRYRFIWDKRYWFLSKKGKVWSESLAGSKELYSGLCYDQKIRIDSSMPVPIRGDSPIKFFCYDLSSFTSFITEIRKSSWEGILEGITFLREGGEDLIALELKREGGRYILLFRRRDSLHKIVKTVSKLLQEGIILESYDVIDATYDDRVVVRKLESKLRGAMGL